MYYYHESKTTYTKEAFAKMIEQFEKMMKLMAQIETVILMGTQYVALLDCAMLP